MTAPNDGAALGDWLDVASLPTEVVRELQWVRALAADKVRRASPRPLGLAILVVDPARYAIFVEHLPTHPGHRTPVVEVVGADGVVVNVVVRLWRGVR